MVIKTCPVDANGYFNFGAANLWHGAVASRAKIVIVETDPALPYVHGIENGLHMSQVDYVIEGDGQPVPELPSPAPTDADRAVARLIATEIDDGACLQIGIGAMPNAVCSLLMESGVRNLGIHTEMLTDGIIDLYKAGVVTGQLQFVRAGYASNGGKSFICMSSTYERANICRSRIVLNLTPGNVVTAPRSDMMFVVTEYGLVNLKGKSIPERAKAMISLAHPDFRDDLEREARTNGLIPRSFA
jgi:acyl-CoA hydrolase